MVSQLPLHTDVGSLGFKSCQNTENKYWILQMEKKEKRHNWDEGNYREMTSKQKSLYPKSFGDPLNLHEILGLKPIKEFEDMAVYFSRNAVNFQRSRAEEQSDDCGSSQNFIYCEEEYTWRYFESDDMKENGEFSNAVATWEVSTNSHTSKNQKEKIQKSFMNYGTSCITTNHQESGFMTAKKSSEVTEAKTIGLESDGSCSEDAMKMEIFGQMTGRDWQNIIFGSNLKTPTPREWIHDRQKIFRSH